MTSLVDGRSVLHVVYYKAGCAHFVGYDTRTRAAADLMYEHQLALPQAEAIESLELFKARVDEMIKERRVWHIQQCCQHEWHEVSEGRQCIKPGCELFIKNEEET